MSDQWFYSQDGRHGGPVTVEQLKSLVASGQITSTALAWREGLAQWVPVSNVTDKGIGFESALPTTIACRNCGATYRVDSRMYHGAKLECEACGNPIIIRQSSPEAHVFVTAVDQPPAAHLPASGLENSRALGEADAPSVRLLLTEYGDAVPYHGINDFGNIVSALSGFRVPVYRITLRTLYEKRTAERKEQAYSGWPIPPLQVGEANVEVWSYDFAPHAEFSAVTREHRIEESQEQHSCGDCGAVGTVVCPACTGAGQVRCPKCSGHGALRCSSCNGRGMVEHSRTVSREQRCPGSGMFGMTPVDGNWKSGGSCSNGRRVINGYVTNEACPKCRGSGVVSRLATETQTVSCPTCQQTGQVGCPTCATSGQVTCRTCSGHRKITCGKCEGNGKVVSFLAVVQELSAVEKQIIVPCSEIPSDAVSALKIEDFRPILVWTDRELPADPESHPDLATRIPWLAENIRGLNQEARATAEPGARIMRQEITIDQTEIKYVQFQLDGTHYVICFVGRDGRSHPISSPFASFTKAMFDEAVKAADQGDFAVAGIYLRQCWDIGRRDGCCRAALAGTKLNRKVLEAAKQNEAHVAQKAAALGGRFTV